MCAASRRREGGIREAAAAALRGVEVERSVQLSCGEHTDYGLLTLVNQDTHVSALQVVRSLVFAREARVSATGVHSDHNQVVPRDRHTRIDSVLLTSSQQCVVNTQGG